MDDPGFEPIAGDETVWRKAVLEHYRSRCSNCGGTERVTVLAHVPFEAGGTRAVSNGFTLCRTCELVTRSVQEGKSGDRRPINFWISRALDRSLSELVEGGKSQFRSIGSLVRSLIEVYLHDPERFDDLEFYQDAGSDVKVNAWVDAEQYDRFREVVLQQGLTMTDVLKALIMQFREAMDQAQPQARA